jgi:hypothetical protein
MVLGKVMVGSGRRGWDVVAGAVGGVNAGCVVGTVTGSATVAAVLGLTVVAGVSSSSSSVAGVVVVVAEDDPDDDEGPLDVVTDETGAGVFPDRSGTLSGGVGSGGLAWVMKRLKI